MSKIEKLTAEQEEHLPVFRKEYLEQATKGARIDYPELQDAINAVYAELAEEEEDEEEKKKFAPPVLIVAESPIHAQKILMALTGGRSYYPTNLWGCFDLSWVAHYKFAEYIGVKFDEKSSRRLEIMRRIGFQCGMWWPYEGFCVVTQRPTSTKWDENQQLHNEFGPSIEYSDGFAVYSWHGTRIPGEWIKDKDFLTPKIALAQKNNELRRCACEIIGWNRVLQDPSLNPVVIDEDEPHIGTLIQVDLPGSPKQWFIQYQCATGRWFAEPVTDKSFDTALKANAGGAGWRGVGDPRNYIPLIRT